MPKNLEIVLLGMFAAAFAFAIEKPVPEWDVYADTWVATDGLGRKLPTAAEVGGPRQNRTVGLFYFLWMGIHGNEGSYDNSRILAADPDVMSKPDSPLWGPIGAMHYWGEPLLGYYSSLDEAVYRKHAQMLADAGVDVVIFDVTNGWTYPESYRALLRAFAEVRDQGCRTPQIAFLCPFGLPDKDTPRWKVLRTLWNDIYKPGIHPELWFRWEGKPLILADPLTICKVEGQHKAGHPQLLLKGHTIGQSFLATNGMAILRASCPTWETKGSSLAWTLRKDGPQGTVLSQKRFTNIADNAWLQMTFHPAFPAGKYYLEMSNPQGTVGWWGTTATNAYSFGEAFIDGKPVKGARQFMLVGADGLDNEIGRFFTFRRPVASYFTGPGDNRDSWSWLEVSPQHVFYNSKGEKEMMSVGVAQNAVESRLGAMSEPNAQGRSWHNGRLDTRPGVEPYGLNFAEQWERALKEDPRFLFVTGWNEWIASRFTEFCGVKGILFPDEFDMEHSRDCEPMRGGHGDAYYYQLAANIRRYKGVRALPPVSSRPIAIDGAFADWRDVAPEFRDTLGDPVHRNFLGAGNAGLYYNQTGRNDIRSAKVSADAKVVSFYVRVQGRLTSSEGANWMLLFLDADQNPGTGWLGYDFIVNRTGVAGGKTQVEKCLGGGYRWGEPQEAKIAIGVSEIELSIPLSVFGGKLPSGVDFKWSDNIGQTGEWSDFTLYGDSAPNDRFNYRAEF